YARELDVTAVVARDAPGDGQAEARAFAGRLGGEERLEHAGADPLGDAGALIDDLDPRAGPLRPRPDPHARPGKRRIARVGEEIDEHLHELLPVARDPQPRRAFVFAVDRPAFVREVDEADALLDCL